MRKIIIFIIIMLLSACASNPATPTPTTRSVTSAPAPTTSPFPASPIPPTMPPTSTALKQKKVDPSSMLHKLLMGYQGWFTCPGDGSQVNGYFHWFKNSTPAADTFRVDMWPDASELTPSERCPTDMKYANGQTAYLYSAYNPQTVLRHFQWMSQYGIDGVFLQRFGSELNSPAFFDERNVVTKNVRTGAEANGRVFAIMYDTSGMDASTFVDILEKDWKYMVDVLKVTESPAYLHHKGKPVLAIWGLGFTEHPGTPAQALELVKFFENNPNPKYRVTLMGGVPTWWHILQRDSLTDPAWAKYYCSLNIISPWTVGRYTNNLGADLYKITILQDMSAAKKCGAEYMPVVYPGSAFHNDSGSPFNGIPRQGGNFYWRQVYNAVSAGAPMIYNAMFDEVDEGTAMYKIAATKAEQPVGVDLVSMDTDGYSLPNDWYLRLAGAASQMLRGEIPLAQNIPIQSGLSEPATPTGMYRIQIQITTSSDWVKLNLTSGGNLANPELGSSSPEATNVAVNGNLITFGQPLTRANSGATVELTVNAYLSGVQPGISLNFILESGAIGNTTVKLFNYLHDPPVIVNTTTMNDMSQAFDIPVEKFISP